MLERLAVASILVMGAIACGSPDAERAAEESLVGCGAASKVPPSSSSPDARTSFAADVLPIFVKSCAFSSCHASSRSGLDNGIFLGAKTGTNDARAIRASLVDRPSTQSPSTPFVTPLDPSRSYLYRKLTGDLCDLPDCAGGRCGQSMPRGGDPLAPADLTVVRTWILQGAPD